METSRPASVDELAAAMRESAGTVRVRGSGTKWSWGTDAADPDVVVEISSMDRLVEHAAGDLVVTAQAGARLRDVQAVLGDTGQWLALDPPEAGATIGGVVATATSGPRRLRFGTPRDLLIGVTVVLADGTVAKSGGKVVKNVAGYDLSRLTLGSWGTFGVILEATFKLHARQVEVPLSLPPVCPPRFGPWALKARAAFDPGGRMNPELLAEIAA